MRLKPITEDELTKVGRLFNSRNGKEVMDILDRLYYNTTSFVADNTHVTAFQEGQRNIVHVFRTAVDTIKVKEMQNEEAKTDR